LSTTRTGGALGQRRQALEGREQRVAPVGRDDDDGGGGGEPVIGGGGQGAAGYAEPALRAWATPAPCGAGVEHHDRVPGDHRAAV
jgi:hypothetical protein